MALIFEHRTPDAPGGLPILNSTPDLLSGHANVCSHANACCHANVCYPTTHWKENLALFYEAKSVRSALKGQTYSAVSSKARSRGGSILELA